MTLFTSYLGFFNRKHCFYQRDGDVFVNTRNRNPKYLIPLYVMRPDRLAPTKLLLEDAKSGKISWEEYRHRYLAWIHTREGVLRMKEIGELAKNNDVVLICYEKDHNHCHRKLLAESIAKWAGVEYKGELENEEN